MHKVLKIHFRLEHETNKFFKITQLGSIQDAQSFKNTLSVGALEEQIFKITQLGSIQDAPSFQNTLSVGA
jgi:hypothetical protein